MNITIVKGPKPLRRKIGERLYALDCENLPGKFGKDRRLITLTRPDFEDFLTTLELQKLRH